MRPSVRRTGSAEAADARAERPVVRESVALPEPASGVGWRQSAAGVGPHDRLRENRHRGPRHRLSSRAPGPRRAFRGGYDFIHDSLVANDGNGATQIRRTPATGSLRPRARAAILSAAPSTSARGTALTWPEPSVPRPITAPASPGINWVSKILPLRVLGKCRVATLRTSSTPSAGLPESRSPTCRRMPSPPG